MNSGRYWLGLVFSYGLRDHLRHGAAAEPTGMYLRRVAKTIIANQPSPKKFSFVFQLITIRVKIIQRVSNLQTLCLHLEQVSRCTPMSESRNRIAHFNIVPGKACTPTA